MLALCYPTIALRPYGHRSVLSSFLCIDLPKLFIELSLMIALPRKRYLSAEQRRALQLLADIPFGVTDTAMFVNGFARQTLVRLTRAGLATTERENLKAGQSVGRVRITETGRRALEGY
jgi:hypothetical protein